MLIEDFKSSALMFGDCCISHDYSVRCRSVVQPATNKAIIFDPFALAHVAANRIQTAAKYKSVGTAGDIVADIKFGNDSQKA
jgi:hypothetical protein